MINFPKCVETEFCILMSKKVYMELLKQIAEANEKLSKMEKRKKI